MCLNQKSKSLEMENVSLKSENDLLKAKISSLGGNLHNFDVQTNNYAASQETPHIVAEGVVPLRDHNNSARKRNTRGTARNKNNTSGSVHNNGDQNNMRDSTRNNEEHFAVVIGDSIIKHINPQKLSKKTVKKHLYPGKTADEICDLINESSFQCNNPSYVILHAGTNNLPTDSTEVCTEKIIRLAQTARVKFPSAKIGVSGITHRKDHNFSTKITEVNEKLKQSADTYNFPFIENSTRIDGWCLNGSNLHLNEKGSALLAVGRFIKFLRGASAGLSRSSNNR